MVHVRHLLREGKTVKEVSSEAGFPHESSFVREFKLWHGVTPGRFQIDENRKRIQMMGASCYIFVLGWIRPMMDCLGLGDAAPNGFLSEIANGFGLLS